MNMNNRIGAGDSLAAAGLGTAEFLFLQAAGSLAAYTTHYDEIFVSPALIPERHGIVMALASAQFQYATPGVGGGGNDVFVLRVIDQTPDAPGTGTVSSSGVVVTGTGTAFNTFFSVGSLIGVSGQAFLITGITDDTHLTLEAAPAAPWAGAAFARIPFLSEAARIAVPANSRFLAPYDLRNLSRVGIPLKAGQGVRLDTAGIGTGYSTAPASVRVRLSAETYGIAS